MKRYEPCDCFQEMCQRDNGEYVKYTDVKHLESLHLKAQRKLCLQQAEIDRLNKLLKYKN